MQIDEKQIPDLDYVQVGGGKSAIINKNAIPNVLGQIATQITLPPSIQVPSNFFTSTGQLQLDFPFVPGMKVFKSSALEIRFSVATSSVTVQDLAHWFYQVLILNSAGQSGTPVQTIWADQLMFQLFTYPINKQKTWMAGMLLDSETFFNSTQATLPVGNYLLRMPLSSSCLDTCNPSMRLVKANTMLLRLFSNPNVVLSGSGTLTCSAINLVVQQVDHDPKQGSLLAPLIAKLFRQPQIATFLQFERQPFNPTLTPGVTTQLNLQPFQGRSAGLILCFRNTTNPDQGAQPNCSRYEDIGGSSTLDIVDAGNQSIFTGGTPNTCDFFKKEALLQLPNMAICKNETRAVYLMNLASDFQAALHGRQDAGGFLFNNSTYFLNITQQSTARAAAVLTFTNSGTPATGFVSFSWAGEQTAPIAVGSASAVAMATAFNALNVCQKEGFTVTFSAAYTAGTSFTMTFNADAGNVTARYGIPQCIPNTVATSAPAVVSTSSAVTTFGAAGPISSSSYTVTVYSAFYNTLLFKSDGNMSSAKVTH